MRMTATEKTLGHTTQRKGQSLKRERAEIWTKLLLWLPRKQWIRQDKQAWN